MLLYDTQRLKAFRFTRDFSYFKSMMFRELRCFCFITVSRFVIIYNSRKYLLEKKEKEKREQKWQVSSGVRTFVLMFPDIRIITIMNYISKIKMFIL